MAQQGGLDCALGQNLGAHELSGWARSVQLSGDVAFFGISSRIEAYSVSDPASPVDLGSLSLSSNLDLVEKIGDELYVSTGVGGATLGIVDVSDPSSMTLLSTFNDFFLGRVRSVARDGDTLYVGSSNGTLMVLDISDLSSPTEITMFTLAGSVGGLSVEGDRLYAASSSGGTNIYDISNAMSPVLLGSFGIADASNVEVDGQTAYVLDSDSGFRVYDCTDPGSVVELADVELYKPHPFWDHIVYQHQLVGDRYYVCDTNGDTFDWFVYDVSDPSNPVIAGDLESPYRTNRYGAFNNEIAVMTFADPETGFEVFDVSTMYHSAVGEIVFYADNGSVINESGYMFKYRERAFPAPNYHWLLQSYDISDPKNPVLIGEYDRRYPLARALRPYGNYLLRTDDVELQIIDVSDPANMQDVGAITIGDGVPFQGATFAIGDNDIVAAWATELGKVDFVDISDPTNPTLLGGYDFGSDEANEVKLVEVRDGHAYVSLYQQEIAILDLSDASNPVEVGRIQSGEITSRPDGLKYLDGVLCVAIENRVLTFSVSDPTTPFYLGDFFTNQNDFITHLIHAADQNVYVSSVAFPGGAADYEQIPDLAVFDLSDPTMPVMIGGAQPKQTYNFTGGQHVNGTIYLEYGGVLAPVSLEFACVECAADLNGDGVLNFFDVSAFLNAYNGGDPLADLNGDGTLNFFDVSAFLNAYNAGCP